MKSISVLHAKIDSMEMPSPAPDGAEVLSNVRDFIRRFCIFPDEHSLVAVTLWAAHTHMVGHFHTTPRLAVLSAELSSGKTRVLEILHRAGAHRARRYPPLPPLRRQDRCVRMALNQWDVKSIHEIS